MLNMFKINNKDPVFVYPLLTSKRFSATVITLVSHLMVLLSFTLHTTRFAF